MDDPELTIMYSVRQVGGIGGSDLVGREIRNLVPRVGVLPNCGEEG